MKLHFLYIGKTDNEYLKKGINDYISRIKHYAPFEVVEIPDIKHTKNMTEQQQKQKEGTLLLSKLQPTQQLFLLDENGKSYSSVGFAQLLEENMIHSQQDIVFAIGGPYGFSEDVYKRARQKISLSKMTFSHQMVRLIFTEQLYRAFTIIKGEPYHHQ